MDIQLQFILQNIHFALNIFAAFVFFATFWLFLDAWTTEKQQKNMWKCIGFLLLSLSFLTQSTDVGGAAVAGQFALADLFSILTVIFRMGGYVFLIAGLVMDPLQKKPEYAANPISSVSLIAPLSIGSMLVTIFSWTFAPLAGVVGFLFFRRSTIGLENHLRPVAVAFFVLTISEIFLALGNVLRSSSNVDVNGFAALFGPLWILEQLTLLVACILLARWVFTYLLKRLQTQLFMIFTTIIIAIFLLTTITFTMLLLENLRQNALDHLQIDVNVLKFAIESKRSETLSDAQLVAQNPTVAKAIESRDKKSLRDIATAVLLAKKQGSVIIASQTGEVLARGEDPERIGDSISGSTLFNRGVLGNEVSSALAQDGVLAPILSISSETPIKDGKQIVGVVLVASPIDSAFVDGVKKATNLDASVYAGNILSATTFLAPDGSSRLTGITEDSPTIKQTVLQNGLPYTGSISFLNIPYFAAYLPLKDANQTPIGMLFVGSLQIGVLLAAGKSIQLTFIVTVILLALAILPAYFVSKYISYQLS